MLCHDINYMQWGNKYLEPKEWEDCIKYKKTRILDIIMLVTKNNTPGYKEHVVYFTAFDFGEGVKISIVWKT